MPLYVLHDGVAPLSVGTVAPPSVPAGLFLDTFGDAEIAAVLRDGTRRWASPGVLVDTGIAARVANNQALQNKVNAAVDSLAALAPALNALANSTGTRTGAQLSGDVRLLAADMLELGRALIALARLTVGRDDSTAGT